MENGDMKENVSGCFFLNTVYKSRWQSKFKMSVLTYSTMKIKRVRLLESCWAYM